MTSFSFDHVLRDYADRMEKRRFRSQESIANTERSTCWTQNGNLFRSASSGGALCRWTRDRATRISEWSGADGGKVLVRIRSHKRQASGYTVREIGCGRRVDGNIELIGMIRENQVKIRGFRIELGEIEAKLSGRRGCCEAVWLIRAARYAWRQALWRLSARTQAGDSVDMQALRTHLAGVCRSTWCLRPVYAAGELSADTRIGKLDREGAAGAGSPMPTSRASTQRADRRGRESGWPGSGPRY